MAFKPIRLMDLWELIRRHQAGQPLKTIARQLGHDPKTIRKYLALLLSEGLRIDPGSPPLDRNDEKILSIIRGVARENDHVSKTQARLEPYREELIELVTKKGLTPKSAFNVLCASHPDGLQVDSPVSYSSFKRFVHLHALDLKLQTLTCRIEVDPGSQMQIDYCTLGRFPDPGRGGVRRILYAFIATLSYSRHKYVEFTFSQDQQSFTLSHVRAFAFFGGVTSTIVLDNLKSGVITPSLYDPQFNRTYREMAEYYGTFLDPARVASPKDKGKVEADVRTVRAAFKELRVLYPTDPLHMLNRRMLTWLKENYGMRIHGTTGWQPYPVFLSDEQPKLLPLPPDLFEAAVWKEATVHPDGYIQVQKKSYSVPYPYVGKRIWVKVGQKTVEVYFDEQLIKQHTIPLRGNRQTDLQDFPDNVQAALGRGMPKYLVREAAKIGPAFGRLIRRILTPHAFMNMRRAQGLLSIAKKYDPGLVDQAARDISPASVFSPKHFELLLERLTTGLLDEGVHYQLPLPMSDETRSFYRPITYYHDTPDV